MAEYRPSSSSGAAFVAAPPGAAVLVDERETQLQLTRDPTGLQADNWGYRDSIFCRRRFARYDRLYPLQEHCNQGESLQAPGGTEGGP